MDLSSFWLFAFTALMLNLTPGNDMIFVAARSISGGSKVGILSAFGITIGCFVHTIAAVLGLSDKVCWRPLFSLPRIKIHFFKTYV